MYVYFGRTESVKKEDTAVGMAQAAVVEIQEDTAAETEDAEGA